MRLQLKFVADVLGFTTTVSPMETKTHSEESGQVSRLTEVVRDYWVRFGYTAANISSRSLTARI
jgi:hypothetical protein